MPQSSDLACTLCDPKNKSSWASKFNSIFFHGNWLIFSWVLVQIPFLVFIFFKIKKKILTLDPWLQHHKLILPSMWIEGRYLKFIQYIFLSRTILLKKYFQTEQYFSFCHRKHKQKNSREISTIAVCPSWSFWLGIIKDLTCLFTAGMCFPIHIVYHEPVTNWCDIFDRLHCWYL